MVGEPRHERHLGAGKPSSKHGSTPLLTRIAANRLIHSRLRRSESRRSHESVYAAATVVAVLCANPLTSYMSDKRPCY